MYGEQSRFSVDGGADIRVLLADDEEMSRRGFSAALDESAGITLIGSTRIDQELHQFIRSKRPDVVLLNSATDRNWVDMVREILSDMPEPGIPKVIVVTGADTEDRLLQAVHAGATGVLLRSISAEELGYAIRHVAVGHSVISPAVTSYLLARLRMLAGGAGCDLPSIALVNALSGREREILVGLACGRSNREIAIEAHLSIATVKSHVSSILTKLDVRDRVQAALLGQRAGLAGWRELDSRPPARCYRAKTLPVGCLADARRAHGVMFACASSGCPVTPGGRGRAVPGNPSMNSKDRQNTLTWNHSARCNAAAKSWRVALLAALASTR